jgi:hypothetical protein
MKRAKLAWGLAAAFAVGGAAFVCGGGGEERPKSSSHCAAVDVEHDDAMVLCLATFQPDPASPNASLAELFVYARSH